MKLSKQSDGSIGVFKVYTQQDSRLRAVSPSVFFMNKPQLWRLIGKDAVSQFKPVSAGAPLTSIRLVNIITLGLMVSHVGGVSVSKSSVVLIPVCQTRLPLSVWLKEPGAAWRRDVPASNPSYSSATPL